MLAVEEDEGYEFSNWFGNWALVEKDVPDEEKRFLNVATAASITGYVRAEMFDSLMTVDTPLYCDTDSIACIDTAELEIDSEKLGAWDLEDTFDKYAIAGKKLYAFVNATKFKKATKGGNLTVEEIFEIAQGNIIKYKPDAPTYSWKRGIKHREKDFKLTA